MTSSSPNLKKHEDVCVSTTQKQKKWKRLARLKGSVANSNLNVDVLGKRDCLMDIDGVDELCNKRGRCESDCVDDSANSLDVTILSFSKSHIDCSVRDADGCFWRFTGFYGEPRQELRDDSWLLLSGLGGLSRLPWVVGGDFNKILKDEEKLGGSCRNSGAMARFRRAVDDCNLMDMGFKGDRFTWNNRQFNGGLIQERLDRIFCNLEWRALFPGGSGCAF
ncbi:hypothetical protein ACOSQ2_031948 [Xanthoceras sorbifolium]